jgi:hypothetical protein
LSDSGALTRLFPRIPCAGLRLFREHKGKLTHGIPRRNTPECAACHNGGALRLKQKGHAEEIRTPPVAQP